MLSTYFGTDIVLDYIALVWNVCQWLAEAFPQNRLAAFEPSSGVYDQPTEVDTHSWFTPLVALTTTGESVRQWADGRRMVTGVCVFLQVELLIENEAEKDYLYDVLRMYHQWVPFVTVCCDIVCFIILKPFPSIS